MIAGSKYGGLPVDIWSCGIILYAMLCGYLPFEDPNTTELYKKILKGDFELPNFLSNNAKDMLKRILNTDPKKRYNIEQIRKHPWYSLVKPLENDEGIMIGYKQVPIDPSILLELKNYNIEPDYAQKCLEANRHNEITTTYYLLIKKYQRNNKKDIIDPNSSLSLNKVMNCSFNKKSRLQEVNTKVSEVYELEIDKLKDSTEMSGTLDIAKHNTIESRRSHLEYYSEYNRGIQSYKLTAKSQEPRHRIPIRGNRVYHKLGTPYEDLLNESHNRSCIENNASSEYSFGVLTETSINKERLRRIYDTYKNAVNQVKPPQTTASISGKPLIVKERGNSPSDIRRSANSFSRRKNRVVEKVIAPQLTRLNSTKGQGRRSQLIKKNTRSVRRTKVDPKNKLTIIKGPLISTCKYNSFNIQNVSMGHIKDTSGFSKPVVTNFRKSKYNPQTWGNRNNILFNH